MTLDHRATHKDAVDFFPLLVLESLQMREKRTKFLEKLPFNK